MFGPPPLLPMYPNMQWNSYRHQHNPHWRSPSGPRALLRGRQQIFDQHRLPFQPGNDNYWCETCDRGFATEDILNKHKQHEKCNIDGCQFVAHPKVITKHIQMQHSSGLYKKIANLQKPEEIEKWREERRKRYPTKTNIDKKVAELKEKIDRGEKMGLDRNKNRFNKDRSGYNRENRTGQGFKRRNNNRNEYEPRSKFKRNNMSDNDHNKKPPPKPTPKIPTIEENRNLKPFAGILHLEMDNDNEVEEVKQSSNLIDFIEDEFEVPKNIEEKSAEIGEPIVCGALSSLMCDYGSTDEEDNNESSTNSLKGTIEETIKKIHNENTDNNVGDKDENNEFVTNIIKKDFSEDMQVENNSKEDITTRDKITSNTKQEPSESFGKTINGPFQNSYDKELNIELITDDSKTDNSQNFIKCTNGIVLQNSLIETITLKNVSTENIIYGADSNKSVELYPLYDTVQNQKVDDDNDSGPEEVKVEKKEDTITLPHLEVSKPNNKVVIRKKVVAEKKITRRPRPKLPATLLQKLLNREMQQERNIVLQCIRYIRKNNYFDKKLE